MNPLYLVPAMLVAFGLGFGCCAFWVEVGQWLETMDGCGLFKPGEKKVEIDL
jgi:hypothetical protein